MSLVTCLHNVSRVGWRRRPHEVFQGVLVWVRWVRWVRGVRVQRVSWTGAVRVSVAAAGRR